MIAVRSSPEPDALVASAAWLAPWDCLPWDDDPPDEPDVLVADPDWLLDADDCLAEAVDPALEELPDADEAFADAPDAPGELPEGACLPEPWPLSLPACWSDVSLLGIHQVIMSTQRLNRSLHITRLPRRFSITGVGGRQRQPWFLRPPWANINIFGGARYGCRGWDGHGVRRSPGGPLDARCHP